MRTEPQRTCPSCGNEFSGAMEFCPVCMLRQGLSDGVESGESSASEEAVRPARDQPAQRFEHYELVTSEDGTPVELGRGAMGVTYKAFDVDLHCPVTLKVINEQYLGDESARLRFLREARAAAQRSSSKRCLGVPPGQNREQLLLRDGVCRGGNARKSHQTLRSPGGKVCARNRDAGRRRVGRSVTNRSLFTGTSRPANIMVRLKEERQCNGENYRSRSGEGVDESASQPAISMPGAFAGTPEFASPEQFAGVGVDIRSDLYSLGVVLWEMVTGHVVFSGSPAEVMYQHQHASLPLDRLKDVSQPVVVLLEVLLEKDPARRFQNPAELLKAMPTITGAIDAGRRITRKSLQEMPPAASPVVTRKPPPRLGQFVSFLLGRANVSPSNTQAESPVRESRSPGSVPKKISVARLPVTGSDVFGREEDIAFLDDAWANPDVNIVTIVAWGRGWEVHARQSLAPTDGG